MINTFETKRLLIRPCSEIDASFIYELVNSPTWLKYIGDRNVKSLDDAKQFIREKIKKHYERAGFGTMTVIRKLDGIKIGTSGLHIRDGINEVDLGFAFLPKFEKNGFAFEASNRIIEMAKKDLKLRNLKAYTREENTPSRRLLEKLGFFQNGTIKLKGYSKEMLIYELAI